MVDPSHCQVGFLVLSLPVAFCRFRVSTYRQLAFFTLRRYTIITESKSSSRGNLKSLAESDPQIEGLIREEDERQKSNLELIASENFASKAVMEATGSCLTNKYAEGYPGDRYYGGCQVMDKIESLGRKRAKELFGAEHANLQPHSGSQANQAIYFSFVPEGGKILAMNLNHGGHLTHGSQVNVSGKQFQFFHYGLDRESERINYREVADLARRHSPDLIVAGASAYPREIDFEKFGRIADEVDALLMVDMAHIAGLVAADLHPDPVPVADFVTGTTHKTLRGPRGGIILCKGKYRRQVDKAVFPGLQGGPLMHVIAAKAVSLKDSAGEKFARYQAMIIENAKTLAAGLRERDFKLVTGGTDNHLLLVDLRDREITGREAEKVLEEAGMTVNKNPVPYDFRPPKETSGIRLGTPAVTTLGMGKEEMLAIAEFIDQVLARPNDRETIETVKEEVSCLMEGYRENKPTGLSVEKG